MSPVRAILVGCCLLVLSPRALGALPDALQIVTSDVELGQRIARSVRQEQPGPVEFVPRAAAGRPSTRTLRLAFDQAGDRLLLALSLGRALKVEHAILIGGNRLDVAEAVALSLIEMRARLDDLQATKSAARAAQPPEQAEKLPAEAAAHPPVVAPQAPQAGLPPEALQVHAGLPQPIAPPRRSPWMLATGAPLALLGGGVLALGAASLAVNGQCVDSAVPCAYRFDSLRAGAGEAVAGAAVLAAGVGLVAIDVYRLYRLHRASQKTVGAGP